MMDDSGYNPDLDSIDANEFMDSLLDDPEILRIYNERYGKHMKNLDNYYSEWTETGEAGRL